ncbi:hypothetical protein AX17_003170 [Amanita inopinata Kibby_2008]|nr:hypothetical protein AX17_003170 [Amanita inopinata Kibby_2008]
MFSGAIQPPLLSLFSSTNSDALRLFSVHQDASLPADSFVHLLHDETSQPSRTPPASLISPPALIESSDSQTGSPGYALNQTVLHIQSPTLPTTYIQSPPVHPQPTGHLSDTEERSNDLWIRHPWMHVQVRNMGREWSLEVGLVDQGGRTGILRLSTFQTSCQLKFRDNLSLTVSNAEAAKSSVSQTLSSLAFAPGLPTSFIASSHSVVHHVTQSTLLSWLF